MLKKRLFNIENAYCENSKVARGSETIFVVKKREPPDETFESSYAANVIFIEIKRF